MTSDTPPRKPLPTPERLIGEAITIALDPSSGELALRRGELALGIARELRQGSTRAGSKRPALIRPDDAEITNSAAKSSPDPVAPAPREPVPANIDERLRVMQRPADLRFGGPVPADLRQASTAVFEAFAGPVAAQWQLGDRADCAHCRTPIVLVARRMVDPMAPNEGDPQVLWVHKYTDQRVCMTPDMGDTMVDVESTAVHTFAEPPTLR